MTIYTESASVGISVEVHAAPSTLYRIALSTSIRDDLLIVDNLVNVTIRRRGSPSSNAAGIVSYPDLVEYPVAHVKRSRVAAREADASGGTLRVGDARFRVHVHELPSGVVVDERWQVIDSDGTWNVLQVDTVNLGNQLKIYGRR